MQPINLKKAILRTLAYFDVQSYPLTATEIEFFLYKLSWTDFENLLVVLGEMIIEGSLGEKYGYYYLPNREILVENRQRNLVVSELKLKKARRAIKFIKAVPFLRAIFVCNTVAAGTASQISDIDFFVIAAADRVWLVRFFTNLILRLFGLRTYGQKTRDKICLSFFVDENNLNLGKLRALDHDIHFIYWIASLIPIYDTHNYWKRFFSANYWIKDFLPNFQPNFALSNILTPGKIGKIWQKAWETMWTGDYGKLLEKQSRDLQMFKMKINLKERANKSDNSIVINDGIIKLHEHDSRCDCASLWQNKINELGINL